jgi:hypothetical protein
VKDVSKDVSVDRFVIASEAISQLRAGFYNKGNLLTESKMKVLTILGEAQQHPVMPVKTGIQEGMNPCSLSRRRRDGLRQDDQNTLL